MNDIFLAPNNLTQIGEAHTEAWAVFANGSYRFDNDITLDVGVRASDEQRTTDGVYRFFGTDLPQSGDESWDNVSPSVSVSYDVSEDVMVYASYKEGFKSGFFLIGTINPVVEPEEVTSYEIGLKSRVFDGRLQANITIFDADYDNLQLTRVAANGLTLITENASSATVKGVEAEFQMVPWTGFDGALILSYLDATYDDYEAENPGIPGLPLEDLSGNRLVSAPEYTATAMGTQEFSAGDIGMIELHAEIIWTDEQYFTAFNSEVNSLDAMTLINARATYRPNEGGWYAALWGKNLTDEDEVSTSTTQNQVAGFTVFGYLRDLRSYGLEVGVNF